MTKLQLPFSVASKAFNQFDVMRHNRRFIRFVDAGICRICFSIHFHVFCEAIRVLFGLCSRLWDSNVSKYMSGIMWTLFIILVRIWCTKGISEKLLLIVWLKCSD